MVYRPTVRYSDNYKGYVDQLFHATSLDRNQIIRLALFTAAFSPLFQSQLKKYQVTSSLPSSHWEVTDHGLWLDQSHNKKARGRGVNGYKKEISTIRAGERSAGSKRATSKNIRSTEERKGEICQKKIFKESGGITIKIG